MARIPIRKGARMSARPRGFSGVPYSNTSSESWRGPCPSSGWPMGSMTRPNRPGPTLTVAFR